jgi:hypothetical protein
MPSLYLTEGEGGKENNLILIFFILNSGACLWQIQALLQEKNKEVRFMDLPMIMLSVSTDSGIEGYHSGRAEET